MYSDISVLVEVPSSVKLFHRRRYLNDEGTPVRRGITATYSSDKPIFCVAYQRTHIPILSRSPILSIPDSTRQICLTDASGRVHRQLAEIFHIERPGPTRPDRHALGRLISLEHEP